MPANLTYLAGIRNFIRATVIPFCKDEDFLYELTLAVEEAVANIIIHGYHGQKGIITLFVLPTESSVEILLQDDAPPFDPTSVPPPKLDLPLDERPLGGLGVHLIRNHADHMTYQRTDSGLNELRLVKICPQDVDSR